MKIRYKGSNCKWWHFFPHETYSDLKSKFNQIMSGHGESTVVNSILKATRKFQLDTFGKDFWS